MSNAKKSKKTSKKSVIIIHISARLKYFQHSLHLFIRIHNFLNLSVLFHCNFDISLQGLRQFHGIILFQSRTPSSIHFGQIILWDTKLSILTNQLGLLFSDTETCKRRKHIIMLFGNPFLLEKLLFHPIVIRIILLPILFLVFFYLFLLVLQILNQELILMHFFNVIERQSESLWVLNVGFVLFEFGGHLELEQQIEYLPDMPTPVKEYLIEPFSQDIILQRSFEILWKYVIVFIQHPNCFHQQVRVVRFKYHSDSCIEIVEVERTRHLFVLAWDHLEIRVYQLQAFYHAISFIKTGLWKQMHDEIVQQLFIRNEFNGAFFELTAIIHDFVPVHFP